MNFFEFNKKNILQQIWPISTPRYYQTKKLDFDLQQSGTTKTLVGRSRNDILAAVMLRSKLPKPQHEWNQHCFGFSQLNQMRKDIEPNYGSNISIRTSKNLHHIVTIIIYSHKTARNNTNSEYIFCKNKAKKPYSIRKHN
jgi:hypothetical protein